MQQPEDGAIPLEKLPSEVLASPATLHDYDDIEKHDQTFDSGSTLSASAPKDDNGESKKGTALTLDDDAIFAHLPEHEKEILKKQLDAPHVKISFFGLYRYASRMDILVLVVSAICAIAAGAALPLFTVS
jgi:ATP-binding cassette subfamily B (MDR/TAP) protein 1